MLMRVMSIEAAILEASVLLKCRMLSTIERDASKMVCLQENAIVKPMVKITRSLKSFRNSRRNNLRLKRSIWVLIDDDFYIFAEIFGFLYKQDIFVDARKF